MSRAVIHEKFGGPKVLELQDVPEPHAGPGEIRVAVAAVGLNPMDPAIAAMPDLGSRDHGPRATTPSRPHLAGSPDAPPGPST
jgi:NADPH:quinone reductase-like Zn-dependent oxidoreductase